MTDELSLPLLSKASRARFSSSVSWKVATLIFLGLLLLIPLAQIEGLLHERMFRKAEAVREIGEQWGSAQSIYGPFLRIPVSREVEEEEQFVVNGYVNTRRKTVVRKDYLVLLPTDFQLKATLDPEIRYRGIFRAPVYTSNIAMTGSWTRPSSMDVDLSESTVEWEKASLLFRVSDPKGLSHVETGNAEEGGENVPRPVFLADLGEWVEISHPVLNAEKEEGFVVELDLRFSLRGSESIKFLPIGRNGEADVESSWPDPSFFGASLPIERTVSKDGFSASWQFGEFGRAIPQVWFESDGAPTLAQMEFAMSGVELIDPVDGYRLTERSLKYGSLFIALGFVVFFLFETLCGLKLHTMHYLLAGAAQAVFFMLVLALSEVVNFHAAYGIAALASVALISMYAASVLKAANRAVWVGVVLAALYGVLHVILKQQDYALIAGSSLLFVALAVFMYLTRKLDWGQAGAK